MAQAWERAGARSLVMSLWRVDDAATSELMTGFLQEALKQPPDKALQAAMKRLRAKDADPAHWAGFAVYGLPGR
jgi:CHAT domain-containing protein